MESKSDNRFNSTGTLVIGFTALDRPARRSGERSEPAGTSLRRRCWRKVLWRENRTRVPRLEYSSSTLVMTTARGSTAGQCLLAGADAAGPDLAADSASLDGNLSRAHAVVDRPPSRDPWPRTPACLLTWAAAVRLVGEGSVHSAETKIGVLSWRPRSGITIMTEPLRSGNLVYLLRSVGIQSNAGRIKIAKRYYEKKKTTIRTRVRKEMEESCYTRAELGRRGVRSSNVRTGQGGKSARSPPIGAALFRRLTKLKSEHASSGQ
ncbi:hypothetical protein J6590_010877 [Homalodisca vitripennis]|nr:hypothetical protein J6590_010877 [Homalodisca vitripennis]